MKMENKERKLRGFQLTKIDFIQVENRNILVEDKPQVGHLNLKFQAQYCLCSLQIARKFLFKPPTFLFYPSKIQFCP
jgi:hypothetical protein